MKSVSYLIGVAIGRFFRMLDTAIERFQDGYNVGRHYAEPAQFITIDEARRFVGPASLIDLDAVARSIAQRVGTRIRPETYLRVAEPPQDVPKGPAGTSDPPG